jgi:hypothetical protein
MPLKHVASAFATVELKSLQLSAPQLNSSCATHRSAMVPGFEQEHGINFDVCGVLRCIYCLDHTCLLPMVVTGLPVETHSQLPSIIAFINVHSNRLLIVATKCSEAWVAKEPVKPCISTS